jgi:hypothetical protein
MTDDTLPPRKPNTFRTWLERGAAWARLHPDWLALFALGFIAGAVLL